MYNELKNKVAVVTGGGGVLCSTMSEALAKEGVRVAVVDLREEAANAVAEKIRAAGGDATGFACNCLDKDSLIACREKVLEKYGTIDILLNGAGGNHPDATTGEGKTFFDLTPDGFRKVFDLNLVGTMLPTQVFGEVIAETKKGNIINISSMSAFHPLTRTIAYSAAKAAISNMTEWLACYFNLEYSPDIRVNAIAPGFLLTNQNRYLLTDKETGEMTPRGHQVMNHTPMGRYGDPVDLVGGVLFLLSDGAKFINGIVMPIDGAFNAYSVV